MNYIDLVNSFPVSDTQLRNIAVNLRKQVSDTNIILNATYISTKERELVKKYKWLFDSGNISQTRRLFNSLKCNISGQ